MKIKDNLNWKMQLLDYQNMTSTKKQDPVLFIYKKTTWLSFFATQVVFSSCLFIPSCLFYWKVVFFATWLCFLAYFQFSIIVSCIISCPLWSPLALMLACQKAFLSSSLLTQALLLAACLCSSPTLDTLSSKQEELALAAAMLRALLNPAMMMLLSW